MSSVGIETGTCFGRGFDAGGLAGKFKAWVVKSQVNHGPVWYILDDQSALITNPYIVVCNISSPTANASRAKIIQVLLPTATAAVLQFSYWNWWDVASHVGYGNGAVAWYRSFVPTVDAGTFSYDFRGGPEFLYVGTLTGTAAVIEGTLIDEWSYIDDNFCEAESKIGTLQNPFFNETGDSGNQLGGYENITNTLVNLDAGGNIYPVIASAGGSNFLINIYKDSAHTLLVGHTASFLNTSTGAKAITADNSSTLGGTITLTATATATTAVSCKIGRVQVAAGEGANFVVNKFYYMFDYSQSTTPVSYVQVTNIVGDELALAAYSTGKTFSAGSMIGAYPHRFYTYSFRYGASGAGAGLQSIPYMSLLGSENIGQTNLNTNDRSADFRMYVSSSSNPNDESNYSAMRPVIAEKWNNNSQVSTGMNREYGQAKNMFFGVNAGLSLYLQGRTINSKNYLYFQTQNLSGQNFAAMILDTESA